MIVDTDPGIDDAIALLFLSTQQEVDIVGVGSVHGNVNSAQAARNARQILTVAGLSHVPVAAGAARPIAQPLQLAEFVHGADGLGGISQPNDDDRLIRESAAEQIVQLARQHPGELDLLCLGPLTNLAVATLLEPNLPKLLRHVVVMGGTLEAAGNVTPEAEANTWHDPEAADLVFGSGFQLTLVGLDVTEKSRIDGAWMDRLAASSSPRAHFASRLLRHYAGLYTELFGERVATLHDALAAAVAVNPAVGTYRDLAIDVELRGVHTRGRTVIDRRGFRLPTDPEPRLPVRVMTAVDAPAFLAWLLDALVVDGD